jgi:signal transduction histidine kinase
MPVFYQKYGKINNKIMQCSKSSNFIAPSVTTVIHDIASPMTLIRLNLDLLENQLIEIKNPNQKTINLIKYVKRAINGVDKIKNIINNSLEDQYSEHKKEIFSVKREIHRIAGTFEMRLINENVKIKIHILSDHKLKGLKNAFQRIMSNLITNSLDAFSNSQEQNKTIKISAFISGQHYVVSVEDNAGGIPMVIQKYLFKQQYTTKTHGNGIGLISIKIIVEKYFSGFIRCYSIKNKGTIFAIALPLDIP